MTRLTLLISAVYLAAVGLALMVVPVRFGVGAVPANASPELIALMRLMGAPFFGIAVLNWLFRNAEPSRALEGVLLANFVGFGLVAANDVLGVVTGEARELAKYFLIVHLLFAFAFVLAVRANRSGSQ